MSRVLTLRPAAKINLILRVGERHADGFHDVLTLLQSVALFDRLTFTSRTGPFAIMTRSVGVPVDATNLVWRAAALVWRELGREGEPRDAHVRLDKQIPVAAGLGGGSADAAAALVGLNELWGRRLSKPALRRLAAVLGFDVPFFLQGGTALGSGRGDELYPVEDVGRFGVVLIKPSFGVGTADAYRWLDEDRANGLAVQEPGVGRELDLGWATGPVRLANDLEGPVSRRHPAISDMIQACVKAGATAAAMTGSGSAVFGLFPERLVARAGRALKRSDWLVLVTRTLGRREAMRRGGII